MTFTIKQTVLSGLLGAALALPAAANAETYKWITFKPKGAGDAQAVSTQWLVDEFAKRTGGKHEIEVFWGGSVAKTREIPDSLAAGVGEFGDVIAPYFPDRFPMNNAVGFFIPQPKSTLEIAELMESWHAKFPQFAAELASSNLKAIGFRPLEAYGLLCTKPVKSVDDLKGLRIRTYGFAYPALVEAMGGTPVSISTAEAYEALERNVIDCTPIGPALARGWKYDEVAKFYMEIPLGASFGHLLAMNLDAYNGMDDETRAIIDTLGKEYAGEYARILGEDQTRVRELWNGELGVEVVLFPVEDFVKFVEDPKVQAVRSEWIARADAQGVPSAEIVEQLKF